MASIASWVGISCISVISVVSGMLSWNEIFDICFGGFFIGLDLGLCLFENLLVVLWNDIFSFSSYMKVQYTYKTYIII